MNAGTPMSLLLIAAGGILAWGVDDNVAGVDLMAVGAILMVVGAIGLMLSLLFWSQVFGGSNRTVVRDNTVYTDREPVVRDGPTVIVERDEPVVRTEYRDRPHRP